MDTSDGEGHNVAVVGIAVNSGSPVFTTIHGDARSPMGVASTTVADDSRLFTLQRSSHRPASASMYFHVTFVARGELTVLVSCLHAPYLAPTSNVCVSVVSNSVE
jgi:hypothetical protein